MTVVVRAFVVTAAPETVIDYLKDLGHAPQWHPSTQHATRTGPGPIVVGTTWHNV